MAANNKHIDTQRLEQSLEAAKKYVDDKVTAEGGPVKELEKKVQQVEGTVGQHTTKIQEIDKKLENGVQAPDAALDSIAGLTGTGVVKMTGEDTFALDQIGDADIKSGEAIAHAKDAFAAKDGSVKTTTVTSDTTVTIVAGDAGGGKPNVMIKTGENTDRVVGLKEMNKAIAEAGIGSSTYMGKFKYFASADTLDNAKAKVTSTTADETALVFGDKKIATGKRTADAWTWEDATWKDGSWAWIEDILDLTQQGNEYPSGKVIYNESGENKTFDTIEDRVGKPDGTSLSYNDDGAIGLKKEVKAAQFGQKQVLSGADADSIGFGGGKTIKEQIDSMAYEVATEQDITEMLNRVFPPKE